MAWVVIVVLFLLGCRSLITDGVADVGTLLPFPSSATDLLREYADRLEPPRPRLDARASRAGSPCSAWAAS